MLLDLPEQWPAIALYLQPKDLLSFLSVHRNIYTADCLTSAKFWREQLVRDRDYEEENETSGCERSTEPADNMRKAFLLQSFMSSLSSVKWLPLSREMQQNQFPVKAREGHNMCVLNGPDGYKRLAITGGFADDIDEGITVIELRKGINSHTSNWGWSCLNPRFLDDPTFVYGASLTPLPSALSREMEKDRFMNHPPNVIKINVAKAVRFGGFEGGGYSGEVNEVWVLTIVDLENDDDTLDEFAVWEKIETKGRSPKARAYHSATLVHDRYLVIIGGIASMGSCIEESILDTKTWTWIDTRLACSGEPRGRHGHSVVWDKRRDRLVMFGGGSGTDLLRTGMDNNEVWELKMKGIVIPQNGEGTMWEWSKIHKIIVPGRNDSARDGGLYNSERDYDDSDSDDSDSDDSMGTNNAHSNLSPSESLCLGRCHNTMKVSPDAVLLMFGGGRPSTNGVLGYDLMTDTFIRPRIRGPLPVPRFTGAAAYLETEGYVLVHGGFSGNSTVLDMNVLDLAPSLGRNFVGFPMDQQRKSQGSVTDEAATNGQYGASQHELRHMSSFLAQMYAAQNMGGV